MPQAATTEGEKELQKSLKVATGREDSGGEEWTSGEICRPPFHHEYTHTNIKRLRAWAKGQERAYMVGATFSGCSMRNMIFINCDFIRAKFNACDMRHCWFIDCSFNGATFNKCTIRDCPGINFKYAIVEEVAWSARRRTETCLTQPRADHGPTGDRRPDFTIDLTGTSALERFVLPANEAWNVKGQVGLSPWTKEDRSFLNGCNKEPHHQGEGFEDAEFDNWKFDNTILTRTDSQLLFHRVKFQEGKVLFAELKQCDLKHTVFQNTDLRDVLFRECDMDDVELSVNAGTRFLRCGLRDVMISRYAPTSETDTISRMEMEFSTHISRVEPVDPTILDQARIVRSTMVAMDTFSCSKRQASTPHRLRHDQEEVNDAIFDACG